MTKRLTRIVRDLPEGHWICRHAPAHASLRPYAEDRAVSILTGAVIDCIENAGISRAEVARTLGTTKSYISQVLNGSTNMTLKTIGALLWACGQQVLALRSAPMGTREIPDVQIMGSDSIMSAATPDMIFHGGGATSYRASQDLQ